jgi:hypothetical protein
VSDTVNSVNATHLGGADVQSAVLMSGLSVVLLILAIAYSMADFAVLFDINEYSAEWKEPGKFALSYWIAYFRVLFKAIIILFFVFIFIVIYDIVLIGFIYPLLKDNIDSSKNIASFGGASDIITASKAGYFDAIKSMTDNVTKIAFGFINLRYAIMLIVVIIPSLIFSVSFVYYTFLCDKEKIKDEDMQKVLKTNFHYMAIFIISLLAIVLMYLLYITLLDSSTPS